MSARRARSLGFLVLILALPVTTQAQFGSLIKRAQTIRKKVDSARIVVDTSRTVVTATKAVVNDVGSGMTPVADSSADSGAAGGGAHSAGSKAGAGAKAAGSKAAGAKAAGGASAAASSKSNAAASNTSAPPSATSKSARKPAAAAAPATAPTTPAARARPANGPPPITQAVYGDFVRGYSAEKSYLKTKPADATGALNAGVAASGLGKNDYASVRVRIAFYAPSAKANKDMKPNTLLSSADIAVLNAHKSDIVQMMGP